MREKIDGSDFVINLFDELYDIHLNVPALHNVYNAMGAAACAKILKIETDDIAKGLKNLKTVAGRLEHVAKYNGADIFVDFAHTPDGLEKSLQSLKNSAAVNCIVFSVAAVTGTSRNALLWAELSQNTPIYV